MYQLGDVVAYGSTGVCRITALTERELHGTKTQYYQLEPQREHGATVLVPVDNDTLLRRMRPVLTAEQIDTLLRTLPEAPSEWCDNEQERKARCREVPCSGDAYALARLACSAYRQRQALAAQGKRLRQSDEAMWKDAERLLCDEIAFVLGQTHDEVARRLHDCA